MTFIRPDGSANRPLGTIGMGLALGSLMLWTGVANAGPVPDGFAGLAKQVTPSVVNIISMHDEASQATKGQQGLPFAFPEGSPFEKFFKQYQDRPGKGEAGPQTGQMVALGSGFVVDPNGYIVTNNHVIDGASAVQVRFEDDTKLAATVVGTDPQTDLALLKITSDHALPALAFGNSSKAEVGDWVMAVGNPFGLGGTVTAGILSARGRNIESGPYDDFLQIDAPINQGNSGGPLFNMQGEVIGVNSAIYSPNGGSVGIGFAIPSNIVKTVVEQLKTAGTVERGWLGVKIQKVTPEIAEAMGLASADGAIVTEVTGDSPALRAGVEQGDIILNFAGEKVGTPRDLAFAVASQGPGNTANMTVWRARAEKVLSVETAKQPAMMRMASATNEGPATAGTYHSNSLNADLATLTQETRTQLGIPQNIDGVIVLNVANRAADGQGVLPGDIINRVGQTDVGTPADVDAAIEKAKDASKKSVLLMINRHGDTFYLGVKVAVA